MTYILKKYSRRYDTLDRVIDLTCQKCGWQIYTDFEDYHYQRITRERFRYSYKHKHCFGRQNRSRPYRPSATPRQKQWHVSYHTEGNGRMSTPQKSQIVVATELTNQVVDGWIRMKHSWCWRRMKHCSWHVQNVVSLFLYMRINVRKQHHQVKAVIGM